jgi:2-hydroxy-6-oxonona-2,4-dienedioate hydrolase
MIVVCGSRACRFPKAKQRTGCPRVPLQISKSVSTRNVGPEQICFYDNGEGPPLVLIHGMFGDFLDWEPVLEPLAQTHRVIALDLPGFGMSSKPRREYTADFFLGVLQEFFAQLGLNELVLIGNSFGAQIAVLYALQHSEMVEKLVLVDSGGFREIPQEEASAVASRLGTPVIAGLTPEIHALLFASVFANPSAASQVYLQRQNEKLQRPDYPAYAESVASSIRLSLSAYLLDRLPEIECPTLLIWGEKDQVLPAAQARQALGKLRQGQLKIIPDCGHAPQLECSEAFIAAIRDFLQS